MKAGKEIAMVDMANNGMGWYAVHCPDCDEIIRFKKRRLFMLCDKCREFFLINRHIEEKCG